MSISTKVHELIRETQPRPTMSTRNLSQPSAPASRQLAGGIIGAVALVFLAVLAGLAFVKSLPSVVLLMQIPTLVLIFGLAVVAWWTARGDLVDEPDALRMAAWTIGGALLFLTFGGWFLALQVFTGQDVPYMLTTTLTVTTLGAFVGSLVGVYSTNHRSQARELREREAKLDEQNERLEKFASIVSHDLRNPLNVAEGHLELIQEDRSDQHVEAVADSLSRMERLIDDLLTMARDAEPVEDPDRVRFPLLVENAWNTVNPQDATLEIAAEGVILADESRARELLENLFDNAVSHGGSGVSVTVEPLKDGFAIEDDGKGIPPEHREEVFEAGHTNSPEGTGFGLYIVDLIAEAHDWSVTVTEGKTGGARFEIHNVMGELTPTSDESGQDGDSLPTDM